MGGEAVETGAGVGPGFLRQKQPAWRSYPDLCGLASPTPGSGFRRNPPTQNKDTTDVAEIAGSARIRSRDGLPFSATHAIS